MTHTTGRPTPLSADLTSDGSPPFVIVFLAGSGHVSRQSPHRSSQHSGSHGNTCSTRCTLPAGTPDHQLCRRNERTIHTTAPLTDGTPPLQPLRALQSPSGPPRSAAMRHRSPLLSRTHSHQRPPAPAISNCFRPTTDITHRPRRSQPVRGASSNSHTLQTRTQRHSDTLARPIDAAAAADCQ